MPRRRPDAPKNARALTFLLVLLAALGTTRIAVFGAASAAAQVASDYHGLTPTRVLDTRGTGAAGGRSVTVVQIAGRGGVPVSGAVAVMVNLTVTDPTTSTYVTAWPTGEARPTASNVNAAAGATVANSALVKLGADGSISLWNDAGPAHLIVDVQGWFSVGGTTPLVPSRLLDTRASARPGAASVLRVDTAGRGGVPAGGVDSVVVNLTLTDPPAATWAAAYPTGGARPTTSSANVAAGATTANLATVKVAADGSFSVYVDAAAHVIVDVLGWNATASSVHGLAPSRMLDTRQTAQPFGPGEVRALLPLGLAGVPTSGVSAVLLNVTVTGAGSTSYWTVYPGGAARPLASNLNVRPGVDAAAFVVATVGPGGSVWVVNDSGSAHLIVDVVGWVAGTTPAGPPPTPPTTATTTTTTTTTVAVNGWDPSVLLPMVNAARAVGRTCGATSYAAAPALAWDARIAAASLAHSLYQQQTGALSHTGAGGSNAGQRMSAQGVVWSAWGENVGWNYASARAMLDGWLASSGHCANIMNPSFTHLGWARGGAYDTMDLARE